MTRGDPQGTHWEGHVWSEWWSLDSVIAPWNANVPGVPGLYRIRCRGEPGLVYIGETGRSLLMRLRHLRRAMQYVAAGKEPGPPHVAGACVLAHERQGKVIEVSWLEAPRIDGRDRKGIECELIAAYRKAAGKNPTCQFAGELKE